MKNKCNKCKCEGYSTSYLQGDTKSKMDELGICFNCAFWVNKIEEKSNNRVIIDGHHYVACSGNGGGMGGRKFKIRFNDGREIEATNLWSQGEIPEIFRDQLSDNAEFMGGAKKCKASDGTICFSESS